MKLKPLIAIICLTLRSALSSGMALWALVAIFLVVTVLPFLMHGVDAVSRMHLAVLYPPVMAFAVMVCGALWLSSGAIAREISGRQLQSVAVKPVHSATVWLGKWLGLNLVVVLWAATAVVGLLFSTAVLRHTVRADAAETRRIDSSVLAARQAILPTPDEGLIDDAEVLRQRMILQGKIAPDSGLERALGEIMLARNTVWPGGVIRWDFDLNAKARQLMVEQPVSLRFRFSCSPMERRPVSGTWRVSGETDAPSALSAVVAVSNLVDGIHALELPLDFQPEAHLVVSFRNIPSVTNAAVANPAVFFDSLRPVELLVRRGGFAGNLLRGFLALVCFVACINALGLAMGSMFSFPVAAFAASSIIFAVALASGVSGENEPPEHGADEPPAKILQITRPVSAAVRHATAGIRANLPFAALADGAYYPWGQVADAALVLLAVLPLLLWLVSSVILAGKELAL